MTTKNIAGPCSFHSRKGARNGCELCGVGGGHWAAACMQANADLLTWAQLNAQPNPGMAIPGRAVARLSNLAIYGGWFRLHPCWLAGWNWELIDARHILPWVTYCWRARVKLYLSHGKQPAHVVISDRQWPVACCRCVCNDACMLV